MNKQVEAFLSRKDEEQIVNAIREAETNTSGEIRVHLEATSHGDIDARTVEVFSTLNMHKTEKRNGVIIYVAVEDREFSIYGDEGIHQKVALDFWDTTKTIIQNHFKKGEHAQGLIKGILKAGKELQQFFPKEKNDVNELSNKLSKG